MVTITESSMMHDLSEENSSCLDSTWKNISPVLLDRWLCLYPLYERHLKEVQYSSGKVIAVVEPHDIEYSTVKVDYYTASQLLLMASQLSYILAGASVRDRSFSHLSHNFYPTFLHKLEGVEIYYTDFHLHFRCKADNSVPQAISSSVVRVKHINGLLFVKSELDFANGSATAKISLVMPCE